MKSVVTTAGGFDKVVFESVIDTLAGGTTLDLTGYTNPDGIVPAGTLVGAKNASTGISPIITASGATLSGAPIGMVHADIRAEDNAVVGVVIEGVARAAALPASYAGATAAIRTALPKITIV